MNDVKSPVVDAGSLFPVRHPSAWMAFGLGLGSLVLGPLLGALALWLARKIRRELRAHAGRITGNFAVTTGVAAAWTCCIAWTVALLTALVAAWPTGAYVLPVCGLVLVASLILRGGPRWLAAVTAAGCMLAVFGGLEVRIEVLHARAAEQAQACVQAQHAASAAREAHDFTVARAAYTRAASTCIGEEIRLAERGMTDLAAQEESERRASEAAAEALAAQNARREAELKTARISQAEQSVTALLIEARRLERARHWDETATALRSIRTTLSPFHGAGGTERLEALSAEVGAIEDRIRPELEKLRAREAADERRAAAAASRREAAAEARQRAAEVRPQRSSSSNRVRCCDGTLSPSCTYDYSLRGCCSHHGGVC